MFRRGIGEGNMPVPIPGKPLSEERIALLSKQILRSNPESPKTTNTPTNRNKN